MINLRDMTTSEYDDFSRYSLAFHADQVSAAESLTPEESEANRRAVIARGMPGTPATPGHFFLRILAGECREPVGSVWFSVDTTRRRAFLWDIVVEPESRGRGYGREAIRQVEKRARALGCLRLALHTNPTNPACRLYQRLGFEVVGVDMQRVLRE